MRSHTTARFRKCFDQLPHLVQRQAREAYALFLATPDHPSLRFKRVHPSKPIHSVRIGIQYRALGIRDEEAIVWFWIGSHADYDRLIR